MEWITKKLVASLVNKWLGHFVEEINSQEVNDALLGGQLNLTNLKVRKDALSFLNGIYDTRIPIEVLQGLIGRISLTVPYSNIFSEPLILTIQDVLLLVTPVLDYDQGQERERERIFKNGILQRLFQEKMAKDLEGGQAGLLGLLYNRIWNNLQLKVIDLHIRYEDTHSCSSPLVIGFCLQSLTAETTNHKWKRVPMENSTHSVSKVVEIVSASMYINPTADKQRLVRQHVLTDRWTEFLSQGLRSFAINEERFKFVVSPLRCKIKIRQHITKEARVPGLLVDAMLRENVNVTLDHLQYASLLQLVTSFSKINLNKKFMKHRPSPPLIRHAAEWWHYAYNSVVKENIRTFSWASISSYRKLYREYVQMYKRYLVEKRDRELEADIFKLEDKLNLETIVAGRMEAKILLSREEPDLLKPVVKASCGWFSWLFGSSNKDYDESEGVEVDVVASRRTNQVLASMSFDERMILKNELSSLNPHVEDRNKEDIDQKIYFSLKELTVTLKDQNKKDIGLCIVTGFVLSFENRIGVRYSKVSVKLESLSVEAANLEDDLVHVLKLIEGTSTVGYGVTFACDFETRPLLGKEDYGWTIKLDPVEISYHKEAIMRLISFFNIYDFQFLKNKFQKVYSDFMGRVTHTVQSAVKRKTLMAFDIDIKSPYIILPEYGSIQSGGNVLIIDLGGVKMFTELGGYVKNVEESTRMELEEKLYDRLTVIVSHFQVLFADSGDEWRVMRMRDDSDLHLLPRIRMKVNFANNVYPELREHPKQKLDIHFTPIKLNLSDNRINHLIEFTQHFPTLEDSVCHFPSNDTFTDDEASSFLLKSVTLEELFDTIDFLYSKLKIESTDAELSQAASTPELLRHVKPLKSFDTISQTSLELAKYFPEESDEEEVNFSKPVDLLGFEDNTSPSNMIQILSRFCIDEIIISISRSSDSGERPYLMIKASRFLIECAVMDYGPAIQITVGSLHLVDKYHHNPTGEYLELVSSPNKNSVITILYRKVRADCPDFKSCFHSCEQSFIVDFSSISFVWHRSAILSLTDFATHLPPKLSVLYEYATLILQSRIQYLKQFYLSSSDDPPVPTGAIKWSTKLNVNTIAVKFCDNEVDFLYIKLCGLQCGCVFKANEKIIFKASLSDLLVEDLSDITLYSRVVEVEEDLVFDIKIVKFSRFLCDISESGDGENMCKPDVSVSIQVGRLQCVLLYKLLADIARFSDSFPSRDCFQSISKPAINDIRNQLISVLTKCKVTLSFCIRTPNLLIPQKSDSPCLLVLNFGDFKVDNFFKPAPGNASNTGVLENILLEIGPIEICRAVMTLGGGLELQESILEPTKIKIDLKRSLMRQCRDVLSWDVATNVDSMYINLGQRDLNTLLGVLIQNKAEAHFPEKPPHSRSLSPDNEATSVSPDDNVGKLQAFLTHSVDIYRIAFVSVLLESIRITLYTDMNEVLSSPVRDAATALCKFEVGEIEIRGDMNNDRSVELSVTLKSCDIYDVRADSGNFIKKIFGHLANEAPIIHGGFKFNLPPLLDVAVKISPNGDSSTEINLDRIRLNMSVSLGLAIYNYVSVAVPVSANSSFGFLNPGFAEDNETSEKNGFLPNKLETQSSSDSTSGYLSTVTGSSDNVRVISISFKTKLPEVVLFVDPEESDSRVIVFRCHVQCDYSKHPGNESFKINLDKAIIFTSVYSSDNQYPYTLMLPCYLEVTWNLNGQEEGEKISIKASNMSFYICPPVALILNSIIEEITEFLSLPDPIKLELPSSDTEDLWSPKPLNATVFLSNTKEDIYVAKALPLRKKNQQLKFNIPSLKIILENCTANSKVPVFALTSGIEAEINDWSRTMYGHAQIQVSFLCFNEEYSAWEGIIEPVLVDGKKRPLNISVQVIQHLSKPIGKKSDQRLKSDDSFDTWSHSDRCSHKETIANESKSSSDEEDNGNNEMVILKPSSSKIKRGSIRRNIADATSMSGYSIDSDSETEGSLLYKITSTFSHMFSSDSELSVDEDDLHTEIEEGSDEEVDVMKSKMNSENVHSEATMKPKPNESAAVSEAEMDNDPVFNEDTHIINDVKFLSNHSNIATTVIVCSKDPFEISITPRMIGVTHALYMDYCHPKRIAHLPSFVECTREVKIVNEVGPNSKVSIISHEEVNGRVERTVLAESKFKEPSSLPSSPGSSRSNSREHSVSVEESPPRVIDWDNLQLISPGIVEDENPLNQMVNQLDLHIPDAVQLYQNMIKQRVKIEVPGFDTLEVFVGTRSQNRLFQLTPISADCRYQVLVIVEISHQTISVIVRSPLQILNDLSLPINICFKKSALQNLHNSTCSPTYSLRSLGSASNPFEEYPSLVTLQPDETYAIPLAVAYHSPIFVAPSATDYQVSESGIWWKEMQSSTGARIISCLPKDGEGRPISIACSLMEGVRLNSSMTNEAGFVNVPNYVLRLSSPIDVYNYLPYTLVLQHKALPMPLTLDPGGCTSIIRMDPHIEEELDVQICNYQGSDWKAVLCIPIERNEASRTLSLTRVEGTKCKMEVSLYTSRDVTTSVYIYAPYWIVNKTGLPLQVRGIRSKFVSESFGGEEILLFRYKKNNPHKLKVKVLESDWSRGWCCDAVGTCGVVICEDKLRNKKFRILAKITHSTLKAYLPIDGRKGLMKPMFQLTKIVTLMPYFLVRNATYRALMYMQESDKNGLWFDIGPNQCDPFWPNSDDMYLVVRKRDTQVISQRFHFNSVHKTILRLEKGRALVVTVDGVASDQPVIITFSKYQPGDAPIRLENWCDDVFLRFHQRGSNQVTLLAPRQSILYTWDDPTLQRELLWNIYSKKNEDFTAVLNLDKHGTEKVTVTSLKQGAVRTQSQSTHGTPKVRPKRSNTRQRARTTPSTSSTEEEEELPDGWLLVGSEKKKGPSGLSPTRGRNQIHLRGTQRDKMVVHWVCHRQENQRVLLFTQSDRLSYLTKLPSENANLEFIFSMDKIGISAINGNNKEVIYGGIFPSTPVWQLEVDGVWKVPPSIELCSWLEDQYLCNADSQVNLKGSMQVDLHRMRMLAPFSGRLRRIKQPALWIHYRHSAHYAYCRAKVNSIQIDNQLEDAVYPNVLSSHRDKLYEKPCLDLCFMTHCSSTDCQTIRHLSLISQEFSINIDRGLLMAVNEFIHPFVSNYTKNNIHSEMKTLLTPLTFSSIQRAEKFEDCSTPVERFCFAGFQLGVSFSPKGISPSEKIPDILVGIFASLGITLGEVKDVVMKVSQLECESSTFDQVIRDIKNHIQHQLLQQLYVLILGLDILGNPYQRLKDLIQGVRELVYDADLATIERPDDYAEEISNEAFSLCGYVAGDDTHSFQILNSALDVDVRNYVIKESKGKYKSFAPYSSSASVKASQNANEGLIPERWFSGVGLAWSLTGMVVDPVAASTQDSIECLLRGRARGLVGLISNSSFGVNDPMAMAVDGLRRAQILGYEAYFRLRTQRHSSQFSPLKALCQHESEGLALMALMPQRFQCHSDKYFGHVYLSDSKHPPIFLATVRYFYYMEPYGNWGRCEIVWKMSVRNLAKQPTLTEDAITFQLRQDEAQSHLSGAVRLIQCKDVVILENVMSLVTSLMTLQMENLPCPMTS